MIFTPAQARAIEQGRKTMHRVLVGEPRVVPRGARGGHRSGHSATFQRQPFAPQVSHTYPVCTGDGPALAQITVLAVRRELAGDISTADAKREGNVTADWWKQAWVRNHDKAWFARERVADADDGDQAVPTILLARFQARWASVEVWVMTFWLDEAAPRFLARPTRTTGDYVTNASRGIDNLPVADAGYVEAKAREDHATWKAQQASFRRDSDAERFDAARRKAEAAGLDTAGAAKLVRRATAALQRAVDDNDDSDDDNGKRAA